MKKKTTTEKYIEKAVDAAKKELAGTTVSHCVASVNVEIGDAAEALARALEAQARANERNSAALQDLAACLKPSSVSALRVGG